MNNNGFKGNAPEIPNVVQLISFLYVGVAELNDGHLSDNEILKMVEKHKSYGVESKNAFEFVKEAMYWWDDSVKKMFILMTLSNVLNYYNIKKDGVKK